MKRARATIPALLSTLFAFSLISCGGSDGGSGPGDGYGGPTPDPFTDFTGVEVAKLVASDAEAYDEFGHYVSVSGTTVVVGAYGEDTNGTDAGAAYVFEVNPASGTWEEVAKLTASDAQAGDGFGHAVSVSGTTAVVGAPGEDTGGDRAGAAYVFEMNPASGAWEEVAKLIASDAYRAEDFGFAVSVSGTTAVVGAYGDGILNTGAVYVFEVNPASGSWEEVAKLTASDPDSYHRLGYSVSISGTMVVAGAPNDRSAYVFEVNPARGAWEEVAKLTASDSYFAYNFGNSVSVSGTTVVVGSTANSKVYVFQMNPTSGAWEEVAKLSSRDPWAYESFGWCVAVSNTTVVGGAWSDRTGGDYAGAAFLFEEKPASGTWEAERITASDAGVEDFFGESVAMSGTTVVVGAPKKDTGGEAAGAVYIYELQR